MAQSFIIGCKWGGLTLLADMINNTKLHNLDHFDHLL